MTAGAQIFRRARLHPGRNLLGEKLEQQFGHHAQSYRRRPVLSQARAGLGKVAHPENIGLALGHRDDAPRIEQIENVRGLDALVIGGKGES